MFNASDECRGSIEESKVGVKSIKVVASSAESATVEIETLEGEKWIVDVTEKGWKKRGDKEEYYETLHILLTNESSLYAKSFMGELHNQLFLLQKLQEQSVDN